MAKRSFLIFALVALTFGNAVVALGQQATQQANQQANIAKPEVAGGVIPPDAGQ